LSNIGSDSGATTSAAKVRPRVSGSASATGVRARINPAMTR
jgi:hypothetical protein